MRRRPASRRQPPQAPWSEPALHSTANQPSPDASSGRAPLPAPRSRQARVDRADLDAQAAAGGYGAPVPGSPPVHGARPRYDGRRDGRQHRLQAGRVVSGPGSSRGAHVRGTPPRAPRSVPTAADRQQPQGDQAIGRHHRQAEDADREPMPAAPLRRACGCEASIAPVARSVAVTTRLSIPGARASMYAAVLDGVHRTMARRHGRDGRATIAEQPAETFRPVPAGPRRAPASDMTPPALRVPRQALQQRRRGEAGAVHAEPGPHVHGHPSRNQISATEHENRERPDQLDGRLRRRVWDCPGPPARGAMAASSASGKVSGSHAVERRRQPRLAGAGQPLHVSRPRDA